MAARHSRLGDWLATLSGARPDILEAAPGARSRFVALGGVLLSTGGLAVVSAAFAVHMALGVWWPVAFLIGLGWGTVIVNLDRMLLVGMGHDSSVKRNAALAVPRIGLALILGAVIATPLTLQVFHAEIDTEVVTLQAEQADAYKASLDKDVRFQGLPDLQKRVAAEQDVVATGGRNDPGLAAVHDQATAAQAAYDQALSAYRDLQAKAQCELNGTCGTGVAGDGTAYQQAKAAADTQAAVVASAKSGVDAATAAVTAAEGRSAQQAQANLATDQAELTRLTTEVERSQAAFEATNKDDHGLLIRLEALDRLSKQNLTLSLAHRMLSLLFICIELLPVIMKTLLNFGPPTAYDRLAALRDGADVEAEELQQGARRTVEEAKAELLVLAEKERLDRQREQILARQRAAQAEREARRAAEERAAQLRAQELLAAEERASERRLAAARAAEDRATAEEEGRRMWDTGPILGLARTAAARTVRSVRRRPADRVPTAV